MKKISIAIPCYNESENIVQMYEELSKLMIEKLSSYEYEIVFADNKSEDNSRELLRDICSKDKRVKAVFNRFNCGCEANEMWCLRHTSGDCSILMMCDFQEPLDLIPQMVSSWEKGNKVICMIKEESDENRFVYMCREIYYRIFKASSNIKQISQFTGFGLYDKSFIEAMSEFHDPIPFFKGIVAELAPDFAEIPYRQRKRAKGHSSLNFMGYYDSAMRSFTGYTKNGLRIATFGGMIISVISFSVALVYLILKITRWNDFATGNAPILLGVFFFGGCQMLFTGLLGEYVMNINIRTMNHPMVMEEELLNFDNDN